MRTRLYWLSAVSFAPLVAGCPQFEQDFAIRDDGDSGDVLGVPEASSGDAVSSGDTLDAPSDTSHADTGSPPVDAATDGACLPGSECVSGDSAASGADVLQDVGTDTAASAADAADSCTPPAPAGASCQDTSGDTATFEAPAQVCVVEMSELTVAAQQTPAACACDYSCGCLYAHKPAGCTTWVSCQAQYGGLVVTCD